MGQIDLPIACSLEGRAFEERTENWGRLTARVVERRTIPGGVEVAFDGSVDVVRLRSLIDAEGECCPWMSMRLSENVSGLVLSISSSTPTGEQQILDWFG
jgi:hypothetical protein